MSDIEWRKLPDPDFENNYLVSNDGQIRSIKSNKVLSCSSIRGGYKSFTAQFNKKKKTIKVHRMVALAFIPNEDTKKNIVNHKDGNKLNNNVDNLEWVTLRQNNQHAIDTGLIKITKRKIHQCNLDGEILNTYDTMMGAGRETNIDPAGIAKCCKGTRKTAGGYKWKFVDVNPNEGIINFDGFIPTKNFPNYMVNNEGVVYSIPFKKIMKQQKTNDNYMSIQLANNGKRQTFLTHRLVALHFINTKDENKLVIHKDGNKLNNCYKNLKWK